MFSFDPASSIASAAIAVAMNCSPMPAPDIEILYDFKPLQISPGYTKTEIADTEFDPRKYDFFYPYTSMGTILIGNVTVEPKVEVGVGSLGHGRCLFYKNIKVVFRAKDYKSYIANDIGTTCNKYIGQFWHRRVTADIEVVKLNSLEMRRALRKQTAAIGTAGPVSVSSAKAWHARLGQASEKVIAHYINRMNAERAKKQEELLASDGFKALARMCGYTPETPKTVEEPVEDPAAGLPEDFETKISNGSETDDF